MKPVKHPMQPVELDKNGTARFKENKIVTYLLDNGGIDMNKLAVLDFSEEDRSQFAQLIALHKNFTRPKRKSSVIFSKTMKKTNSSVFPHRCIR